ncbi:MAG TPA: ABC transporter substrate-binding protein, partial [Candidatus Deferrimicrobium sp.]|nr:ABC transporter substrate-binding protein [Candidatus Deferrimicrobium sp.]
MIGRALLAVVIAALLAAPVDARAADKFTTIYSARVMAQALPWIAEEAGLFKKYNLDHSLVFIASSSIVTAALLGGDPDMTMTGGVGNVIAFVRGSTDIAYVGSAKNLMTQNIIAGGNLKRPEDLKGKRIAVSRIGSNSHYFTIQALRRHNLEPNRDYTFLQSGGDPESLIALLAGGVEVACLTPPTDVQALSRGYHYVIYGPILRYPMPPRPLSPNARPLPGGPSRWRSICGRWVRHRRSCTASVNSFTKSWPSSCAST